MEKNMVCDMYSGICKPSEENEIEPINFDVSAPNLTLYYVTDPMCSHCWAFEPTLNKLLVQYGHLFNFQMVMGGLLEEWGRRPDRSSEWYLQACRCYPTLARSRELFTHAY